MLPVGLLCKLCRIHFLISLGPIIGITTCTLPWLLWGTHSQDTLTIQTQRLPSHLAASLGCSGEHSSQLMSLLSTRSLQCHWESSCFVEPSSAICPSLSPCTIINPILLTFLSNPAASHLSQLAQVWLWLDRLAGCTVGSLHEDTFSRRDGT